MRSRLWFKRIHGFRLRVLHRRRAKGKVSSKAKPTSLPKDSPVYVSGNLSLPPSLEALFPCYPSPLHNPKAVTHGIQRPSTLSPVPSPALTTTPTGHNTPLTLKDLLGFEAVDRRRRKPNTFAHIASSLSCCKKESPEMKAGSNDEESYLHALGEQKGTMRGPKSKWTGLCPCMFVSVEKQVVKKGIDVETTKLGAQMTLRPSTLTMKDTVNVVQTRGWNATSLSRENAEKKGVNVDQLLSANASSVDKARLATEHSSSGTSQVEVRSALPQHLLLLANGKNCNSNLSKSARAISRHDHLSTQAATVTSTLPGCHSSFATTDIYFSAAKGGSDVFSSAISTISKADRWASLHGGAETAQRGVPLVQKWLRDGKNHQEQAFHSHRLVFGSLDQPAPDLNEVGSDEESSLLQADSYESSDTFSISSHSPWLNDQSKQVAFSANASVDLEAKARPWSSTENHACIPTFQCTKSVSNHSKTSKREHAKALMKSYHEACSPHPVNGTSHEMKTNTSIHLAGIANGNHGLKVSSSSAHDSNANHSLMTMKAYPHKQVSMHRPSKSSTEIKIVNQELNPASHCNKGVRNASKDELLVATQKKKTGTIMLPVYIIPTANQEHKHSSSCASIDPRNDKRFASTQMPDEVTCRAKSDTILLPFRSSSATQEQNPPSAQITCKALIPQIKEGAKGSHAVEKKSRDPYVDFTDSMLNMILQNHLCSCQELEELLQCFLSINSLEHHDVIVQAFTEVWEKVVVGKAAS